MTEAVRKVNMSPRFSANGGGWRSIDRGWLLQRSVRLYFVRFAACDTGNFHFLHINTASS